MLHLIRLPSPSWVLFFEVVEFGYFCTPRVCIISPLSGNHLCVFGEQVTIINSMGVYGRVVDRPVFHPHLNGDGGGVLLDIGVTFSRHLWPWTGYLALHISVRDTPEAAAFRGLAEGWISLKVESDDPVSLSNFMELCVDGCIAWSELLQMNMLILAMLLKQGQLMLLNCSFGILDLAERLALKFVYEKSSDAAGGNGIHVTFQFPL